MDPHPNQHQLYVIEHCSKTNYIILFRVLLVKTFFRSLIYIHRETSVSVSRWKRKSSGGNKLSRLRGSENNDAFRVENGRVVTETNHCGGILGGITNGMPLVFRAAFKPTPSIARPQRSVALSRMEDTTLAVEGRHDPCIVPRAVPCIEAAAAIAVLDAWLDTPGTEEKLWI